MTFISIVVMHALYVTLVCSHENSVLLRTGGHQYYNSDPASAKWRFLIGGLKAYKKVSSCLKTVNSMTKACMLKRVGVF